MKSIEKDSRRGGSARQVHHKEYCTGFCGWYHPTQFRSILYNGPDTGSIGSRVMKWTVRQCRSRRVGDSRPKTQN